MSSEVYFASVRAKSRQESLANKIEKLFVKAGFEQITGKDELVAIKLHFGEAGTTNFIKPIYVRAVVDKVRRIRSLIFTPNCVSGVWNASPPALAGPSLFNGVSQPKISKRRSSSMSTEY